MPEPTATFEISPEAKGLYDLYIGGRCIEYDIRQQDFADAIRRSRHKGPVKWESSPGRLTPWTSR